MIINFNCCKLQEKYANVTDNTFERVCMFLKEHFDFCYIILSGVFCIWHIINSMAGASDIQLIFYYICGIVCILYGLINKAVWEFVYYTSKMLRSEKSGKDIQKC